MPFAPFIQDNFLLLHDNAHPKVSECVTKYLGEVGIQRMVWPARSPDINPIELVWDMLGRSVRIHFCENLEDMQAALQYEWERLPQKDIPTLIRSVPSRCAVVIRVRGGNIRY